MKVREVQSKSSCRRIMMNTMLAHFSYPLPALYYVRWAELLVECFLRISGRGLSMMKSMKQGSCSTIKDEEIYMAVIHGFNELTLWNLNTRANRADRMNLRQSHGSIDLASSTPVTDSPHWSTD